MVRARLLYPALALCLALGVLLVVPVVAPRTSLPSASAADTPTVPLLTGGLLRVTGSAKMEYHFHQNNKIDEVYGPVDFDTTFLFNGVYPNTLPPARSNWPPFPGDDHPHAISWGPAALTGTFDEMDPGYERTYTQHCDVSWQLEAPMGGGGVGPGSETGYLPAFEGDPEGYTKVCTGDQLGYPGPAGLFNYADSAQLNLPAQPWHAASRAVPAQFHDPHDGNNYTGHVSARLSCAICVNDIVFKQRVDPTTGEETKEEVPDTGTYDGNIVEISATVHNAASVPLDVPFTFVDETTSKPLNEADGSTLVRTQHFNAGETRTITFDWDTRGTAWRNRKRVAEHTVAVLTQFGGAQRKITVLPKPVVLVHGWNSDASTWGTMKSLLKAKDSKWAVFAVGDAWAQPGMTMNTDPVSGNSIEQNAEAEGRYIEHVRQMTRAQHVDLVVHSMGGLISRDYIDHMMLGKAHPPGGKPLVSHLVMLGTPNQGSACAYAAGGLAALFGKAVPSIQLTPAYVDGVFNRFVRNQHGVKFSVDAGTGYPVCFTGDGDTVVTRDSAWWIYNDVGELPGDIHTELPGDSTAVDHWVMPHIAKAWFEEEATAPRSLAARKAKAAPGSGQLVALTRATVRKGHPVTIRVPAAKAKQLVVTLIASPRVSAVLKAPGGKVIARQKASSSAARRPFRGLRIAKPKTGRYRLVLTDTASKATTAMISAALVKPKVTQSATAAGLAGRTVRFTAVLKSEKKPLRKATVRAYVRRLGGKLTTLRLYDDGHHKDGRAHDGRYAGRTKALLSGDYAAVVKGSSKSVVRWSVVAVRVP